MQAELEYKKVLHKTNYDARTNLMLSYKIAPNSLISDMVIFPTRNFY